MAVGGKLTVGSKPLKPITLQRTVVAVQIIQYLRFQHHKTAVNPTLANLGLFDKILHQVTVENKSAKA